MLWLLSLNWQTSFQECVRLAQRFHSRLIRYPLQCANVSPPIDDIYYNEVNGLLTNNREQWGLDLHEIKVSKYCVQGGGYVENYAWLLTKLAD